MPYWPGRKPQVNDKYRTLDTKTVKSTTQLEGLPTEGDIRAGEVEAELAESEAVATMHLSRQQIRRLVRALPLMRSRADKRTRPNRVDKKTFKLYRWLRLDAIPKRRRTHASTAR